MMDLIVLGSAAAVLYALAPVIQRYLLKSNTCSVVTMIAVGGLMSVFIGSFFVWANREVVAAEASKLSKGAIALIALAGVGGGFLANYLFAVLLHRYDAHIVNVVYYMTPILTVLFAFLLLEERMSPMSSVGFAFVVFGTVLVVAGGGAALKGPAYINKDEIR